MSGIGCDCTICPCRFEPCGGCINCDEYERVCCVGCCGKVPIVLIGAYGCCTVWVVVPGVLVGTVTRLMSPPLTGGGVAPLPLNVVFPLSMMIECGAVRTRTIPP